MPRSSRKPLASTSTQASAPDSPFKVQLDRLALKGAADLQVTDDGVLVYVFSGFLSSKEKERAEDF